MNEKELLEKKKVQSIVASARKEFLEKGIISSKLKDIAKNGGVGIATLYRYFRDKTALVSLVATSHWLEQGVFVEEYLSSHIAENDNGLEKLTAFLNMFKVSYVENQDFLKFLEDFDNYMMRIENVQGTSSFEDMIFQMKHDVVSLVELGISDGSIQEDADAEIVYAYISQVIVPTLQKLAIRAGHVETGSSVEPKELLDYLINLIVSEIKTKK